MKAIIFDLDGVLVRTTMLHITSLGDALSTIASIDIRLFPELLEVSMASTFEKIKALQELYGFDDEVASLILDQKDFFYRKAVRSLVVDPNVYQTLEYIRLRGIKTAIASNSRLKNINQILDENDLRKYFDVIVSAEEVEHRKPAPDILYEVYRRLGVDGIDTLFVEDTDEGAEAGHNSPSTVVRVNSPLDLTPTLFKKWIE